MPLPSRRCLGTIDHGAEKVRGDSLAALRRSLAGLKARQDRLVRTLEAHDDVDGTVFARVRGRLGELEARPASPARQARGPAGRTADAAVNDADLLDELPFLNISLLSAPDEHLRLLFDGFRLQVRDDTHNNNANVEVTIEAALDSLGAFVIPLFADQGSPSAPGRRAANVRPPPCFRAPSLTQC